jgi:hypothetical protein
MQTALSSEIDTGELPEGQAIALAQQFLADNQRQVFDLDSKRRAIAARLSKAS